VIQYLLKNQYPLKPWKNNLGLTYEIATASNPADKEKLLYRLSQAVVRNPSAFSDYSGYNRWLTILEGDGLKLNQQFLFPDQIIHFSGDEKIFCENLSSEVIDLGLIYDFNLIEAEMKFLSEINQTCYQINLQIGLHFLFVQKGTLQFNGSKVRIGDTLQVDAGCELSFQNCENLRLIHLCLKSKKI
jgi:uncharacterized protein